MHYSINHNGENDDGVQAACIGTREPQRKASASSGLVAGHECHAFCPPGFLLYFTASSVTPFPLFSLVALSSLSPSRPQEAFCEFEPSTKTLRLYSADSINARGEAEAECLYSTVVLGVSIPKPKLG